MDDGARAEGEAGGGRVGLSRQGGGQAEVLRAKAEGVADGKREAFDQDRVHDRAGKAIGHGQRLGHGDRRVKLGCAGQGPCVVDGLDLGKGLVVRYQRHRAEVVDLGHLGGDAVHVGAFVRVGGAVGEPHLGVAAEDHGALIGQALLDAGAQGADGGNGRDAKREAGEEHAEPAQAAAKLAPGDGEGKGSFGGFRVDFGGKAAVGETDHPVTAGGKLGRVGHKHKGRAVRSRRPKRRSMIAWPLTPSRLPVGSSARRIAGRGAAARARATRCCSPPDIWLG
jgi:hypothetical protein